MSVMRTARVELVCCVDGGLMVGDEGDLSESLRALYILRTHCVLANYEHLS